MSKIKHCSICKVSLDPYDTYQQKNKLICGACYKLIKEKPNLSHEEIRQEVLYERTEKDHRVKDFIIVTVPEIQGRKINKYYNMITSELVIGTGLFSEFSASISDVLGMTGAYSHKLKEIKRHVYDDLANQAASLGANAIVGADAEYMKIGNNMIMFSVSGTPVTLKDN